MPWRTIARRRYDDNAQVSSLASGSPLLSTLPTQCNTGSKLSLHDMTWLPSQLYIIINSIYSIPRSYLYVHYVWTHILILSLLIPPGCLAAARAGASIAVDADAGLAGWEHHSISLSFPLIDRYNLVTMLYVQMYICTWRIVWVRFTRSPFAWHRPSRWDGGGVYSTMVLHPPSAHCSKASAEWRQTTLHLLLLITAI